MMIVFWIVLGLAVFAFALAAQMRLIISIMLRRALAHRFGGYTNDTAYRLAVVEAASPAQASEAAIHLAKTYPNPLSHLRLARRVSLAAPVLILMLLILGRFALGVI
ncbi:MAG: hypothetical protein KJ871_11585 [Alphaproteobacteria bacterium]|nr:hypothetical protein [Alphaproteobacteria bacterium]MBU2143428.1 hypothetical protein [Alphaproteobacteria bacterium]